MTPNKSNEHSSLSQQAKSPREHAILPLDSSVSEEVPTHPSASIANRNQAFSPPNTASTVDNNNNNNNNAVLNYENYIASHSRAILNLVGSATSSDSEEELVLTSGLNEDIEYKAAIEGFQQYEVHKKQQAVNSPSKSSPPRKTNEKKDNIKGSLKKEGGTTRRSRTLLRSAFPIPQQAKASPRKSAKGKHKDRKSLSRSTERTIQLDKDVALRTDMILSIVDNDDQDQNLNRQETEASNIINMTDDNTHKVTPAAQPNLQTVPSLSRTSSYTPAPPENLTRADRLQSRPGAVRIGGYMGIDTEADNDDEEDSASFSVTDPSTYNGTSDSLSSSQAVVATATTIDPIKAVLVEDHEEMETQRQRELEEREASIRERELELERKLKQLTASQAVKVEVVKSPSTEKGKGKKSFFGFFKGSSKKNAPTIPLAQPKSSMSDLVVAGELGSSSLVTEAVDNHLGQSSRSSNCEDIARLAYFAGHYNRKRNASIPLFQYSEVHAGSMLSKGKLNCTRALKGLKLHANWTFSDPHSTEPSSEQSELQNENRQRLAQSCQKKGLHYVIKCLQPDLPAEKRHQGVAALRSEASFLAALSHKHILSIVGMDEREATFNTNSFHVDSDYFYITEQLQDTLFDRLSKTWPRKIKGPQFFADRMRVAADLASAVSYLHSLNIVYCDLKPESIGFDSKNSLKLCDFGGAQALTKGTKPYDYDCHTFHVYMGTHPYVAPEVALRKRSGMSIDTYAFSILLWEIITLKEPFADLMIHEYTEKVLIQGKRLRLDKKFPDKMGALITSCWDADPKVRPSMKEVHPQLAEFATNAETQADSKRTFPFMGERR